VPLTLSHPAAVLPFRKLGLPVTALVVGSMAPDLPLFVHWFGGYKVSHSLLGVATLDLAITITVVWLWFRVLRPSMVDLAPDAVRSRMRPDVSLTRHQWFLVVPAAWVGALTHVIWDAFTHSGRWGVDRLAWLRLDHAGLPGYAWAQYGSSLVGLAVVAVAAAHYLRELPPSYGRAPRSAWVNCLLPTAALVGVAIGVLNTLGDSSTGLPLAFRYALNVNIAVFQCVALTCLAWRGILRKTIAQ
jgi:hypothetical protein